MIKCPYHLGMVEPKLESRNGTAAYVCPDANCKAAIHRDFVERLDIPRTTVGLIGFSGHGKTVYITSLFYFLKYLRNKWADYYCLSLDDNTHKILHYHVPLFEDSQLPKSTPANFPFPSLIHFHNIPFFRNWFACFYDTAGAVFENTQKIADQGRFVACSDVLLFIISIIDCGKKWPDRMVEFLDTYIRAVWNSMRADLKKQHLIVVLTKADSLGNTNPTGILSEDLVTELNSGFYKNYLDLNGREDIIRLKERSINIRNWLIREGGQGFVSIAKDKFKSVEYTLVSSTGSAPVGDRLLTKLTPEDPKLVLDPFLWILEKSRRKSTWKNFSEGYRMKVFNLIYTKVPPEDSPWGKTDFHTVFYSTELMSIKDIMEIEKKIHFFETEEPIEKGTVFYQNIQGEDHLVILHIRSLPEARDTFGRRGIFLCQGFIFPPDCWRSVSSPLILFELLKHRLFSSREDVLSSSLVDRKTGDIKSIGIPKEELLNLSKKLPPITTEPERKIVLLLNRISNTTDQKPTLLLKGSTEKISALMNKLIAYVPDDLKTTIGWDPGFETGNLAFYPLRIVGYKHSRPMGGNNIEIDVDSLTIQESPETSVFFQPRTPYENWLASCPKEANSKEQIERAYKLSLLLESEVAFAKEDVLSERAGFVSANRSKTEEVFLERCNNVLGIAVTQYISGQLTPNAKLDLLIDNLPMKELASAVETVIIDRLLTPKTIKTQLPKQLIKTGSNRLGLIVKLWRGEKLTPEDLKSIDIREIRELINYLLMTEYAKSGWMAELLEENEEMFKDFLAASDTRGAVENILLWLISKEDDFKGIERLILKEVQAQKKEFQVVKKQADLMNLLEDFIKKGTVHKDEMKSLTSWASKAKPPEREFPYIKVFLFPQYVQSNDLESSGEKDKLKLIRHLLISERARKDWIVDLLQKNEKIFVQFLSYDNTKKAIHEILLGFIPEKFKGIEEIILNGVSNQQKEYVLLKEELEPLEILEKVLRDKLARNRLDKEEIRKIVVWAKKRTPPEGDFPYIKAFLYPTKESASVMLKNEKLREKLLDCLRQYHGYKRAEDFDMIGLDKNEALKIEEEIRNSSVMGKIKGIKEWLTKWKS